jgi:hypothetical protein
MIFLKMISYLSNKNGKEKKPMFKLRPWHPRHWTFFGLHIALTPYRLGISSGFQKDSGNFSFSFDNSIGFY